MSNELQHVEFNWSTRHGECEECGLPAAFHVINAYGVGKHMKVCAVCAANAASEGSTVRRIESLSDSDTPDTPAYNDEEMYAFLATRNDEGWVGTCFDIVIDTVMHRQDRVACMAKLLGQLRREALGMAANEVSRHLQAQLDEMEGRS